jgi:hypothetical protein
VRRPWTPHMTDTDKVWTKNVVCCSGYNVLILFVEIYKEVISMQGVLYSKHLSHGRVFLIVT